MDYKKKYIKYKAKYLKLKQIGGYEKTLEFDLTFMIPYLKRLINECDLEFAINFIIDETDNSLKAEFIKGLSDMTMGKPIYNSFFKFGYLNAHTHFESYQKLKSWKISPPSSGDYVLIIKSYFRFYLKKHLVFTNDGIWTIEINESFKFDKEGIPKTPFSEKNAEQIKDQMRIFNDLRCNLDYFYLTDSFRELLDHIEARTTNLQIRVSDEPGEDKEVFPPITLEEYIHDMNDDGIFVVSFKKWEEVSDLKVTINISEFEYNYVNHYVKYKDKLYKDTILTLYPLNLQNIESVFIKLKEAPEGTEIIF